MRFLMLIFCYFANTLHFELIIHPHCNGFCKDYCFKALQDVGKSYSSMAGLH